MAMFARKQPGCSKEPGCKEDSWGRSSSRRPLLRGSEPFVDFVPVDDVVEGAHVIGSPVLVVKVIGVLPDVDAENRGPPFGNRTVLIGSAFDDQLSLVDRQPGPAAAEAADRGLGELLFERGKAPERAFDGFTDGARGFASAAGSHHRPEGRVIGVAAAVVADGG